ncbi:MAG: hypothetical protein F6K09_06270 [Merismopedia sp. SIO2A8]|nr:hypothetical protein [Symploca sp. SIO2B6]NET48323.1 hypothetical protein [Merismopedia sp. SIO2A8]
MTLAPEFHGAVPGLFILWHLRSKSFMLKLMVGNAHPTGIEPFQRRISRRYSMIYS